jgi:hypothetical protein
MSIHIIFLTAAGEDFHALYRTVLVDTPVGKYFTQFLQGIAAEKSAADPDHVRATFVVSTHQGHSSVKFPATRKMFCRRSR